MSGQARKKFRSKWFRVAVEGATTDGRQIERQWIEEMAASYNRATYGARIWLEHMRGLFADGPFRAYGDVLEVKAEEIDIELNGKTEKRLALFAQLEPTDDLVTLANNLKQKIFTSIEVNPKFANTGKAYLMGLAVTDSPASLGTEVLAFAAQHPDANPFAARKQAPENLFSAAVESLIEFEEIEDKPGVLEALFSKIDALLSRQAAPLPAAVVEATAEATGTVEAFNALREHLFAQDAALAEAKQAHAKTSAEMADLTTRFNALSASLDAQPATGTTARPVATGSEAADLTDC
ncbi:MAG: GPO family capsid scaffolding protein [Pseudomonadota bacterium]|nr:GPO family capsid scaffolding protein [Pseudomonadota bacterium]